MHCSEAVRLLKKREGELKKLGVVHLYLFGSTARDEAGAGSDVDLFFDHPRGELSLYGLMDIKELAQGVGSQNSGPAGGHHDEIQPSSGAAGRDRSLGSARVLMAVSSAIPRLQDIVEAIDHIHAITAGLSLDDFETDWQKRWLAERGVEIISEASRHLSAELKARHADIPWPKVVGIGNILRHEYERVAPDILMEAGSGRSGAARSCLPGRIGRYGRLSGSQLLNLPPTARRTTLARRCAGWFRIPPLLNYYS